MHSHDHHRASPWDGLGQEPGDFLDMLAEDFMLAPSEAGNDPGPSSQSAPTQPRSFSTAFRGPWPLAHSQTPGLRAATSTKLDGPPSGLKSGQLHAAPSSAEQDHPPADTDAPNLQHASAWDTESLAGSAGYPFGPTTVQQDRPDSPARHGSPKLSAMEPGDGACKKGQYPWPGASELTPPSADHRSLGEMGSLRLACGQDVRTLADPQANGDPSQGSRGPPDGANEPMSDAAPLRALGPHQSDISHFQTADPGVIGQTQQQAPQHPQSEIQRPEGKESGAAAPNPLWLKGMHQSKVQLAKQRLRSMLVPRIPRPQAHRPSTSPDWLAQGSSFSAHQPLGSETSFGQPGDGWWARSGTSENHTVHQAALPAAKDGPVLDGLSDQGPRPAGPRAAGGVHSSNQPARLQPHDTSRGPATAAAPGVDEVSRAEKHHEVAEETGGSHLFSGGRGAPAAQPGAGTAEKAAAAAHQESWPQPPSHSEPQAVRASTGGHQDSFAQPLSPPLNTGLAVIDPTEATAARDSRAVSQQSSPDPGRNSSGTDPASAAAVEAQPHGVSTVGAQPSPTQMLHADDHLVQVTAADSELAGAQAGSALDLDATQPMDIEQQVGSWSAEAGSQPSAALKANGLLGAEKQRGTAEPEAATQQQPTQALEGNIPLEGQEAESLPRGRSGVLSAFGRLSRAVSGLGLMTRDHVRAEAELNRQPDPSGMGSEFEFA